MAKVFSRRTLGIFEDASASIPLTQLDRVFEGAGFRLGSDPGGAAGARRVQFRRYVASVDQHDRRQVDRLGDVLGALIEEVATSKQDFLVKAAERDGFVFANGAFRASDLASIDDRAKRLHLLADDSPKDAVAGAKELVESVCRTILRLDGRPGTQKTAGFTGAVNAALDTLELASVNIDDAKKAATLVQKSLQQLGAVVESIGKLQEPSPRHARLAAAAAVAFAGFVAETHRGMRKR